MIATLAVLALVAAPRSDAPIDAAALTGEWVCHGHFVKSGRPLDATVTIAQHDLPDTVFVDHRDRAPGTYHSAEIWSLRPQATRAAIADATGMRWFEGRLDAEKLVFTRDADGSPVEQFVYRRSPDGLSIEWSYRTAGGVLALGDTLSCTR